MARQLKLPMRIPTAQLTRPHAAGFQMAKQIAGQHGNRLNMGQFSRVMANPRMQHSIYKEYVKAEQSGNTDTPELRSSYDALKGDLAKHYAALTGPKEQGGLGINVEPIHEDPYTGTGKQFMNTLTGDVNKGTLKVMSTKSTGGHQYFTDEENDQFRAVHDFFGHVATGRDFSRHGEEAAWRLHSQMVSPEARPALTAELRAQNAYKISSGRFPEQSQQLIGLPDWTSSFDEPDLPQKRTKQPKVEHPQLPGMEGM